MSEQLRGDAAIESWFHGRLPDDWFVEPASITVDKDEILVVGRIATPTSGSDGADGTGDDDTGDGADTAACEGRIARFREDSRGRRMGIANQAQERFGRTVSWGASCGEVTALFTHVSAPVMTRLRQPERAVLDTLVEAGVARSRSEAVAWCVRLVGDHEGDWIAELHDALDAVRTARARGPESRRSS